MKNGFLALLSYNQCECEKNYVQTISKVQECSDLSMGTIIVWRLKLYIDGVQVEIQKKRKILEIKLDSRLY